MSDLPSDIVREILIHVSAEHVVRFRSVCKSWKLIIDDDSFAMSNFHHHMDGNNNFIVESKPKGCFLLSLDSLYPNCQSMTIEPKTVSRTIYETFNYSFITCNGLVAGYIDNMKYALWNPLTGECRNLPSYGIYESGSLTTEIWNVVGFGYDVVTNDYKVVRMFANGKCIISTIVYSLKSDLWYKINNCPNHARTTVFEAGVFVKGAIHWLAYSIERELVGIIALDLTTEKYRQISILPPFSEKTYFGYYLSALNDCLIFSHCYDAWIFNDYGGNESWTKLLSLKLLSPKKCGFNYKTKLLAYDKSKEQVLILYGDEYFLWYHLQTGRVRKVTISGLKHGFSQSHVFPTSLIRINGSYMKETLYGSRERLKLELTTSNVSMYTPPPIEFLMDDGISSDLVNLFDSF